MPQITSETITRGLAGTSVVFLAWFFGNVIWERIEHIPQIEAKQQVHERTISQNTKDIDKLYIMLQDSRTNSHNYFGPGGGASIVDAKIRFECSGGRSFDMRSWGGDLLRVAHVWREYN